MNGQHVKKERRAVTTNQGITIAEIDSKTEDGFDVWNRERADSLVQANKLLKNNAPWIKSKKQGQQTVLDLPEEEQRSTNPRVVSAKPGTVNFEEPGVEFSRPQKEWEPLTDKSQLEPGDKLRTSDHSFAELMLLPDTHLRLDQASEVLFEQLSNDSISIKLLRGAAILDVARFDTRRPPQITLVGPAATALIAAEGNYRIDANTLAIRDGKVLFNNQPVGACRTISSGSIYECDKKRTDNFDFWSRYRGEGRNHNGAKTVSMVTFLALLRQHRFKNSGFWFQNFGQPHYTFVPFKYLLFRSPYGGSYSTVLSPESNRTFIQTRTVTFPSHDPPPMPPPPRPGRTLNTTLRSPGKQNDNTRDPL